METRESPLMMEKDKNIELTKPLFSENTVIKKKENGSYQVDTVLDDGICDGGQKVSLQLLVDEVSAEAKTIDLGFLDEGILLRPMVRNIKTIDPYINFRIASFKINDQEIIDHEKDVYLLGQRRPKYGIGKEEENLIFKEGENAVADVKTWLKIGLFGIKNGDDIVRYFHEKGHLLREKEDIKISEVLEIEDRLKSVIEEGIMRTFWRKKIPSEDVKMYRKKIFEERRANIKGLDFLKGYNNIFPNDPDLLKVKLFNTITLSTYININKDLAGTIKNEVERITDFDKDWHF